MTANGTGPREIDWASAAVSGATLTVGLSGPPPRGWRGHFERVLRLLDQAGGRCGRISIVCGTITVADVREGHESDVRHLLESVVQQVNADLGLEPDDHAEATEADRAQEADRAMATAFRGFAETPA